VDYDTYNAEAAQLAIELANLDMSDTTAVGEFLRLNHGYVEGGTAAGIADPAALSALAEQIREVVIAASDSEVAERLNALLAEFSPQPRVTDHDGTLHLHFSDSSASLIARLGATVSIGLAHVICRYGRDRLGVCAAGDCAYVFIDTSKNRSRRYCSVTCASRTTVSAYRARQRAAGR
jgi:predicted RNA-binding Zn ribbon-like protein